MNSDDSFGRRLRGVRLERSLNQTELAAATGLQPSAIGHFESGRRRPCLENLRRLSKALGVTSDYLIGLDKGSDRDKEQSK